MSTIAVNAITNAAGGNTATINGMTPTADSLQGFRNRIINGDMRIDQRNAGASVGTASGTQVFGVDRFSAIYDATSKLTMQQGSTTPPVGFVNYLRVTSSSAYSATSSQAFIFEHIIEGNNVSDLAWGSANAKTVTLSFWIRSSLTGTFAGSLEARVNARSYVFTYTISAANTWEYKTITIAGDTSGTWATNNDVGIKIRWDLGSGSNFQGTVDAWQAGDKFTASGATAVIATSGATWDITGVQLEAGSVASPFERRTYGTELALCQRYYQVSSSGWGWPNSATGSSVFLPFFCPMRASPSATLVNGTNTFLDSGVAQRDITGISTISTIGDTTLGAKMDITNASTTTGKVALIHPGAFAFNAEL